jgi:hypothetical protein
MVFACCSTSSAIIRKEMVISLLIQYSEYEKIFSKSTGKLKKTYGYFFNDVI